MTAALAHQPSIRRLAVVCFGLSASRQRRQPWHTAEGLARGLANLGHELLLITDVPEPPAGPYRTLSLPRIFTHRGFAPELAAALASFGAERAFVVIGAARLMRLADLSQHCAVTLVMASQRLHLAELSRLSLMALWRERAVLALPLLDAVLPGFLLRFGFRRSRADDVIYLSEAARLRYRLLGLPAGRQLKPQVALAPPQGMPARCERPTLAYLGPALEARGADLVLDAFEQASNAGLRARLLLLLRGDGPPSVMRRLVERCQASPQRAWITCDSRHLNADELRRQLAVVDAFVLPFRVTVSDVPLVVIEAGLTGKPVVVLDTPGVSEIARAFHGIVVADTADLPTALTEACRRPRRAPPDPGAWTSWERAAAPLLAPRQRQLDDLALLALCGGDGVGKTTLADSIAARLAAHGRRPRRVWSRFRNYLSRPLLALTRLTGHNRKEVIGGVRVGYHDFARCRPLAVSFLALQLIDCWLDLRLRFRARHDRPLLADRCVLDTLVDLAVDTGLDDFIIDRAAPWLAARLPRPCAAVLVERPVGQIAAQRPDALADRHFARRQALYRRLAERLQLPLIGNERTVEAAVAEILRAVGGNAPSAEALS